MAVENPYRVMIIGQDRFGEDVLSATRNLEGVEVPAVVTPKSENERVRISATKLGIEAFPLVALDDPNFPNEIERLKIDLIAMAFVNKIIHNGDIFTKPKDRTIMYHPSLLPRWRGRSAISQTILSGDTTAGLSIIFPDGGIDTGRVLLQKEAPILPDDDASLYRRELAPKGVEAMVEAILLSMKGGAYDLATPQDDSKATFAPWYHKSDTMAIWHMDPEQADRRFRGLSSPGIWTRIAGGEANPMVPGEIINLLKTKVYPQNHNEEPSTILSISEDEMRIAIQDGIVSVGTLQDSSTERLKSGFVEEVDREKQGERLNPLQYAQLKQLTPGMSFAIPQAP